MFRELTRKHKQLPQDECICLLEQEKRGVLSVLGDGGYPYGMPMNHWYNAADGCIYFHCGHGGHRLDALQQHDKVSFCVYDQGTQQEGDWALLVKSVIVFGRMQVIYDMEQIIDITTRLCHKFTDDEAYIASEIENFAAETLLLKLTPEHICGKLVKES
ncbi:MAG: pyridoxamine 5'-phosphate oxidase family protein [Firmicutes bacterium]|nr:pyridoxamine 5'-phosphate oxidase family protein [Bacillota bacterium]